MRPPITQRCQKTNFFDDNIKKDFGHLDLLYRAPDIGLPSCEIEKDNFRDSQGKQIPTEI